MSVIKSPNINSPRRRLVLGLMFLVAVGVASATWNWNRLVHLSDPDIVFHTKAEAVDGARQFLAAAKISTSDYDISHASYSTPDRLKGLIVWRIVWLAKPDATLTNKLSVLASETGWFYMNERISTNVGIKIEGNFRDLTNITRQHLVWKSPEAQ